MPLLITWSVVVYVLHDLKASKYDSVPLACSHVLAPPMYATATSVWQQCSIIEFLRYGTSLLIPRSTALYLANLCAALQEHRVGLCGLC